MSRDFAGAYLQHWASFYLGARKGPLAALILSRPALNSRKKDAPKLMGASAQRPFAGFCLSVRAKRGSAGWRGPWRWAAGFNSTFIIPFGVP